MGYPPGANEIAPWILRAAFTAADGVDPAVLYAGLACPAGGTLIKGNGFEAAVAGPAEQGTQFPFFSPDFVGEPGPTPVPGFDRRGRINIGSHWAKVEIVNVTVPNSPGVEVRGNAAAGDDFIATVGIFVAEVLSEHTGAAVTFLGLGGGGAILNDDLYLTAEGTAITCGLNHAAPSVSVASALHPTGFPGIYCERQAGVRAALGDNWEAGNMGTTTDMVLVDDETEGQAWGFPLEIAADKYQGSVLSSVYDVGVDAHLWFSILVDSYAIEAHLVSEATYAAGSGEARWRTVYGRQATEGQPGADFEFLAGSLLKVDDPDLRVCGPRGGHGAHTGIQVEVRFERAGVWGPWRRGEWNGRFFGRKVQCRVTAWRESLLWNTRVSRIDLIGGF